MEIETNNNEEIPDEEISELYEQNRSGYIREMLKYKENLLLLDAELLLTEMFPGIK